MDGDGGWRSATDNDWDLHAVLRFGRRVRTVTPLSSSSSTTPAPAVSAVDTLSSFLMAPAPEFPAVLYAPPASMPFPQVSYEISNAFFPPVAPPPPPQQQPAACTEEAPAPAPPQMQLAAEVPAPPPSGGEAKIRKKYVKKVVQQVEAADGGGTPAKADPWAWRKYGQKPIKGSPYPRGYYRCSTDKDCPARKMVERCRTDPASFLLSYTGGDHTHPVPAVRNSLAGVARNRKLPSPDAAAKSVAGHTEVPAMSPAKSHQKEVDVAGGHEDDDLLTAPFDPATGGGFMTAYGGASLELNDMEMDMAGEDDDELLTILNPGDPSLDDIIIGGGGFSTAYYGGSQQLNDFEIGDDESELLKLWNRPVPATSAAAASLQPNNVDENETMTFLNNTGDPTGGGSSSYYTPVHGGAGVKIDVQETFVVKPWMTAPGGGAPRRS